MCVRLVQACVSPGFRRLALLKMRILPKTNRRHLHLPSYIRYSSWYVKFLHLPTHISGYPSHILKMYKTTIYSQGKQNPELLVFALRDEFFSQRRCSNRWADLEYLV
ncbi:hypothetical protein BDR05DRAFT_640502 [Suillus weaverae]|nr:hypothetical protein BDR05DRAFT_640502 [Suillus weaverae]